MKQLGLLALLIVPMVLIGCGSSSPDPSEAELRKSLAGPPSLEGMHKKMQERAAKGKLNGEAAPAAATAGAPAPAGN